MTALVVAVFLGLALVRVRARLAAAGRRYDRAVREDERLERLAETDPDVQAWRRLTAEKRADEAQVALAGEPRWDGNVRRVVGGCCTW